MLLPRLEDVEKRAGLLDRLMVPIRLKSPVGHLVKVVKGNYKYMPEIYERNLKKKNDQKNWGAYIHLLSK